MSAPGLQRDEMSVDGSPTIAPDIEVVDLGTLGGRVSVAWAINDEEIIVGTSLLSDQATQHVFVKNPGSPLQDIGNPPGSSYARPQAINARGDIAGFTEDLNYRAFIWTRSRGFHYIGTLAGGRTVAKDIDNTGNVVGYSEVPAGSDNYHAFLWRPGRGMLDLGTLGGSRSYANGISEQGIVVGETEGRAFSWTDASGMRDLQLPGYAGAWGINDAGLVMGAYQIGDAKWHAYRLTEAGQRNDLPIPRGSFGPSPIAIGNGGHVVGLVVDKHFQSHAFLDDGAAMVELPALPNGGYAVPLAVAACGRAVGYSGTATFTQHAVLWRGSC